MVVLLLFFLLLTIGTLVAYRLSSASKVKRRMQGALSPLEELDAELRQLRQSLQNEIELSSSQYVQQINAARLKAISLDELKKHATGLRLQALKDVGVWSIADLQGWNEYRVSAVRGVGGKSASAIVQAVARITAATKATPIEHPAPPFLGDTQRQLMQALYRQRWFDVHIAEQGNAFAEDLVIQRSTRDEVVMKTGFSRWLWKFGSNETIQHSLDRANAAIGSLEGEHSRSMRGKLSTSLGDGRAVFTNSVPAEPIIQDFNENREFYDSWLNNRLGKAGGQVPAKPMPQQTISQVQRGATDLVHVEFGRVVPGPPPSPVGESGTNSASPSKIAVQHSEQLISVGIGFNVGQQPTEFALPIAERAARSKDLRWLMRNESMQIQGHNLPHGFVYVGKGINSEQHYALNPWLSAKAAASTPSDNTGYYFSYPALNEEQRSRYLDWLAEGASSSIESGFGMLYFYGLERRILDIIQGNISTAPAQELEQLREEVHRLGELFQEKPGSVTQCCLRLLDFAAARAFDGTSIPEIGTDNAVEEFSTTGEPASGSQFLAADPNFGGGYGLNLDSAGNVWIAAYSSVYELSATGSVLSPSVSTCGSGYCLPTNANAVPSALALDASNNVWVTDLDSNALVELSPQGSLLNNIGPTYSPNPLDSPWSLAIDASNYVWIANNNDNDDVESIPNEQTSLVYFSPDTPLPTSSGPPPFLTFVAIDGAGNSWSSLEGAACSSSSVCPGVAKTSGTRTPLSGPGYDIIGNENDDADVYATAIDGSGDVWMLNKNAQSVTELIGAAAPVVTPLALAVSSNSLGVRP
ncbi:MAG: TerB N-terminal domain-containing protein [Acidobacteriaceae bacterium]